MSSCQFHGRFGPDTGRDIFGNDMDGGAVRGGRQDPAHRHRSGKGRIYRGKFDCLAPFL